MHVTQVFGCHGLFTCIVIVFDVRVFETIGCTFKIIIFGLSVWISKIKMCYSTSFLKYRNSATLVTRTVRKLQT